MHDSFGQVAKTASTSPGSGRFHGLSSSTNVGSFESLLFFEEV